MLGMNAKAPFGVHPALQEAKFASLHSSSEAMRRVCLPAPQGNIFGSFDESLLARAEALAAVDLVSHGKSHPFKPDATYHTMSSVPCTSAASSSSPPVAISAPSHHHHHHHAQHPHHHPHHPHPHHHAGAQHQSLDGGDLLEHLSPALLGGPEPGAVMAGPMHPHAHPHLGAAMGHLHQAMASMAHAPPPPPPSTAPVPAPHAGLPCLGDVESDPRELEAFAERFKQRRIKLGVTQADVGAALASLKLPGVGSLSQSTICRFESLTLSHNNMIALKPVLQAWLDEAEAACRERSAQAELLRGAERKRKRTSIAAPEKRSLEAYFALQPRPSSEKIAAIADKLELKKNVVRVWFCNQRQKQKRMKYSAGH
ncbi:POU domain, class 4, transcription factor 3 isoform X1 [Podarcis raffonei]|uniref:POU domain, class 4, transcription factor 3 isoform X1 n=1 Tax=Podarcis raffonei TaxID=65483 RepID=UPI0023295272|nr:POU domain, class 4, transcription factor 3 isoform X1 [Podarcis raffonei]